MNSQATAAFQAVLSDGSIAWNVQHVVVQSGDETHSIIFACENEQHAKDLAALLSRCAWTEVSPA